MRIESIPIDEGQKFGILTVGPLVRGVQDHPLFITTPQSYLQHGRLRECVCDCGVIILYSENVLSSGQIRSCGCIRRKRREEAHLQKESREKHKAHIRDIAYKIKVAQSRLKFLQNRPAHMVNTPANNLEIDALGLELRKLFGAKSAATRRSRKK